MNNEVVMMIGTLIQLIFLLFFVTELRAIGAATRRTAEATERIKVLLDWFAQQRGGGG